MTESEVVAEAPDVSDLLREGEALSRGRKYGEALDRFNGPSRWTPQVPWHGTTEACCSRAKGMQRVQSSRLRFAWTLNQTMHLPRRTWPFARADGRCRRCRRNGHRALTHYPDHPNCSTFDDAVRPASPWSQIACQRPHPPRRGKMNTHEGHGQSRRDGRPSCWKNRRTTTRTVTESSTKKSWSGLRAWSPRNNTCRKPWWRTMRTLRLHRLKRRPSSQNLNTISQRWRISSTKRRVNSTPVIRKPPSGCCEIDSERTVQKTSRRGLRQRPPCID